ncbi:hypothetical protein GCM10010470_24210 [Saccharopolyspora taberi]|uniref:Uncharacterized protein n=1 Tax=Saccharopolyspora taberi TaxID=60895 RepID=A0ABN3VEI8_9PSEU
MKNMWRRVTAGIVVALPAFLTFGPLAHAGLSYNHNETVL